jgi:hypothetical protein
MPARTVRESSCGARPSDSPNIHETPPQNVLRGPEAEIDVFSSAVVRLKSAADYEQLLDGFGVRRSNEKFRSVYDAINSAHLANDPARSGTLDLTRYTSETK